jgi:hypothetical protein
MEEPEPEEPEPDGSAEAGAEAGGALAEQRAQVKALEGQVSLE